MISLHKWLAESIEYLKSTWARNFSSSIYVDTLSAEFFQIMTIGLETLKHLGDVWRKPDTLLKRNVCRSCLNAYFIGMHHILLSHRTLFNFGAFCSLRIEYKSSTYTDDIKNAVGGLGFATQATMTGMAAGMVYTETIAGVATTMAITATLTVMTAGLGVLAGVLTVVAVRSAICKSLNYVRNIDSYEEVLDLAIREAKAWKSPQESDEATMPMEQRINKEHELKCQGFNLIKLYPFQSDVV